MLISLVPTIEKAVMIQVLAETKETVDDLKITIDYGRDKICWTEQTVGYVTEKVHRGQEDCWRSVKICVHFVTYL